MLPQADQYTIADIKAAADIVEEIDANVAYLGFCNSQQTGTDDEIKAKPCWAILKVTRTSAAFPRTTEMKWATGLCMYNQVWNDRVGLDYKTKRF